jgi:AhpC/TSA family
MPAATRSRFLLAMAAAIGLVSALAAQPVDPQSLGPKAGERVPDFSLPDQHGTTRTLRSTLGPKGAVLVFFRSADW